MALATTMILASSCNKEPMQEGHLNKEGNTVNFTATTLLGGHMSMNSLDMYMIQLSDEENIFNYPVCLNNHTGKIDDNGYVTIPSGTYTQSNTYAEYTISEYAVFLDKSEGVDNAKKAMIEGATAIVTETETVLTAVVEGVTHVVTYNGPLSMPADLPDSDADFVADYACILHRKYKRRYGNGGRWFVYIEVFNRQACAVSDPCAGVGF